MESIIIRKTKQKVRYNISFCSPCLGDFKEQNVQLRIRRALPYVSTAFSRRTTDEVGRWRLPAALGKKSWMDPSFPKTQKKISRLQHGADPWHTAVTTPRKCTRPTKKGFGPTGIGHLQRFGRQRRRRRSKFHRPWSLLDSFPLSLWTKSPNGARARSQKHPMADHGISSPTYLS